MANLRISELDFDTIKANLKTFLQSQNEFTDYDFEGSGLSVLIDLLAYNTHYNAYLANMVVNEMFLDSAVKRSSAVSIAKHLGYTPRSAHGARAIINVTVNNPPGNPATITLPRYTPFTTTVNETTYNFLNIEEVTIQPISGIYSFQNLTVVEGEQLENTFVVADPGPSEKFEIKDTNVDTSTLLVTVQNSASDTTTTTYTLSNDITGVDGSSNVFFLEENPFGRYQIFFGDGLVGRKLEVGNIITIRYLSVSGSDANVSDTIDQTFSATIIGGSSNITIETVSNSTTGALKESISSIKFNAPLVNAARNRAVTADDYKALITANFSDAESVIAWGGENNIPPVYGKVFISLKPFNGFTITQATKDAIANEILANKKVLAIQPVFVDPDYFYVNLNVNAKYNSSITTKSAGELQTIINNTIVNYFSSDLQKFEKGFNKSKLMKLILESDPSLVSVLILIKLQKRLVLNLNSVNSFTQDSSIKFDNPLTPGTFVSSRFFSTYSNTSVLSNMIDIPSTMPPDPNGSGTIRLIDSTTKTTLNSNIGTINYGTGEVVINEFTPIALQNNVSDFRLTASVQESGHNLQSERNQVLVLDDSLQNRTIGREAGLTINVTEVVL